jgi:hypothetical protein
MQNVGLTQCNNVQSDIAAVVEKRLSRHMLKWNIFVCEGDGIFVREKQVVIVDGMVRGL